VVNSSAFLNLGTGPTIMQGFFFCCPRFFDDGIRLSASARCTPKKSRRYSKCLAGVQIYRWHFSRQFGAFIFCCVTTG
jgi:hypothetical protein